MINPIKIIIADDHEIVLEGIKSRLQSQDTIEVIDAVKNGKELLEALRKQYADIILLDYEMPQMNGFEAIKYIKMSYPAVKIIILSAYSEGYFIEKARLIGANGYLIKDCTKDELFDCINNVIKSENLFTPVKKTDCPFGLTKTEIEIIQYIKEGLTNEQIAKKINRSILTIETHHRNINRKLGVKTLGTLLKFIIENHL